MAYRFNMDLQELRRLMGWIEWRCDVLKDHPQLPLMVQVVRAHVEDYHDLFDANPFQHSMLEDAKAFGHRTLKGVGDSIYSNPKNVFVAENADKVGAELEGVLYLGLNEAYNYHCLEFTMEFFSWFVMSDPLSLSAKATTSIPIVPMIWQLFGHPFRKWNRCALACMPTDDVENQYGDSFVFQVSWCKAPNRN